MVILGETSPLRSYTWNLAYDVENLTYIKRFEKRFQFLFLLQHFATQFLLYGCNF